MSLVPALFVWTRRTASPGCGWCWRDSSAPPGTCSGPARSLGDASLLTPISFVQVLVVGVYGWLLFDETVDRWTAAGATVVLASNYYIAYRETKLARQTVTDPEVGSQSRLSG